MKTSGHVRAVLALLAFAGSVAAQALSPLRTPLPKVSLCNADKLAHSQNLTLGQRACYFGDQLTSTSTVLRAAFASGISQWRNNPYKSHQDNDDYAYRFGVYYARRTAKNSSELLVGYLNHEDPRPRHSTENGVWNRTRSALLSVVLVRDEDGNGRPALSPIAGAFGSGFVGTACYRTNNTAVEGLRLTGISYSSYFIRAVYNEFRPDISAFAYRLRHKKDN